MPEGTRRISLYYLHQDRARIDWRVTKLIGAWKWSLYTHQQDHRFIYQHSDDSAKSKVTWHVCWCEMCSLRTCTNARRKVRKQRVFTIAKCLQIRTGVVYVHVFAQLYAVTNCMYARAHAYISDRAHACTHAYTRADARTQCARNDPRTQYAWRT